MLNCAMLLLCVANSPFIAGLIRAGTRPARILLFDSNQLLEICFTASSVLHTALAI
jgi:hypothetical protein